MTKIDLRQVRGAKDLLQDAVEAGVNATESVHRAIARKPYAILSSIDAIAGPVRQIEQVQSVITTGVYLTIRTLNKTVGAVATLALDRLDQKAR